MDTSGLWRLSGHGWKQTIQPRFKGHRGLQQQRQQGRPGKCVGWVSTWCPLGRAKAECALGLACPTAVALPQAWPCHRLGLQTVPHTGMPTSSLEAEGGRSPSPLLTLEAICMPGPQLHPSSSQPAAAASGTSASHQVTLRLWPSRFGHHDPVTTRCPLESPV